MAAEIRSVFVFGAALLLLLFSISPSLVHALPNQVVFSTPEGGYAYPPTPRTNASSVYKSAAHGDVTVHDPYRWLEQDSWERHAWVSAQDSFATAHLHQYSGRSVLFDILSRSHNYTQFEAPFLAHDGRSTSKSLPDAGKDGLGDLEAISELFFDPNMLSDGSSKSLMTWRLSPDKALVAYSISTFGSDVIDILICRSTDIKSADTLTRNHVDTIVSAYDVVAWGPESDGLYYTMPVPLKRASSTSDVESDEPKIYWHKLGSPQVEDKVVLVGEPGTLFEVSASADGAYLLLFITSDSSGPNRLWMAENKAPTDSSGLEWVKLKDTYDGCIHYIANDGPSFLFMTDAHSDRNYVVTWTFQLQQSPVLIPVKHIPASKDRFLQQYLHINADYAVAVYSHNVNHELYILPRGGTPQRLDPDYVGTITIDSTDNGFSATFESYTTPKLVKMFRLTHPDNPPSWKVWRDTKFEAFPLEDLVIKQLWYTSKDGTRVPLFVLHGRSTKLDGTAPCLQYGHGTFMPSEPFFSPMLSAFVYKLGGIVAFPIVRGGFAFGLDWIDAGSKAHKMNSVDDFTSATEYLVAHKYTSSPRVCAFGWGSGGALIATSVARAGTFGCVISSKADTDLLRFPLFSPGSYWIGEIGDPSNPGDFDFIYPTSPLHNVPSNKILPPTLIVMAGGDARIAPMHGYKFAATSQHNAVNGSGVQLVKVVEGASHETGESISVRIEEDVIKLGFMAQSLGIDAN